MKQVSMSLRGRRGPNTRNLGFTLTELAITLTIAAGLLVIGMPSMSAMIASQKVRGAANELFMDLAYARNEAIKRNATVQLVRSGANWTQGWSLLAGGAVLKVQPQVNGISSSGASDSSIAFRGDGRSTLAGSVSFNFYASNSGMVSMRCVIVSPSGQPSVQTDRNRNGDCRDG
jgi:type IV fimbrial biogenesis protein FimT